MTMTVLPLAQVPSTALAVQGLCKAFGGTQALQDFDLSLAEGEVHALVGGNGSGKSTLIKILAGVARADAGTITRDGVVSSLMRQTPAHARQVGLRFVHQNLGVIPGLSVMDNMSVGHGYPTGLMGRIRWKDLSSQVSRVLVKYHVDVDPRTPLEDLPTPQRAMVAIARALQSVPVHQRAVLVLDEPTASLPQAEADLLLRSLRNLACDGHTILIVTHRIDEVRQVADRVTGIRDGRNVGTIAGGDMTESDAVELILGRRLSHTKIQPGTRPTGDVVLEVRNLSGGPLRSVDLTVRAGEIVGIAGLLGSGRTELLSMIFGTMNRAAGDIRVAGKQITSSTPGRMRRLGVAFVPEERPDSLFAGYDVAENMTAGGLGRYLRRGLLHWREMRRDVAADMARFGVKADSSAAIIDSLSGGNQQKVVLARWLRDGPRLILLDEPAQGIDVASREEIFAQLLAAADEGAATLLVSSEFEELRRLADRVLVLCDGRFVDEFSGSYTTHELLESVLMNSRLQEA